MMLAKALAATPWGIEARPVQVEVDISNGIPQTHIVGLPDTAVRESRERVRSAIRNSGFQLPSRVVVINLAPADLRKEGNQLDLAIALALLAAHELLPADALRGRLICGELGLDGAVRPVRGGLAIAGLAHRLGVHEVLLPAASAKEAAALGKIPVRPVFDLGDAIAHITEVRSLAEEKRPRPPRPRPCEETDLREVRGHETAKRALEIAAAGGHNLLFVGPPGSGKTMLARCLPALLPPLSRTEAIAVTKIQSLVAEIPPDGLVSQRPFRSPHTATSTVGLIGGGTPPRPGEVSLSHAGVLFLDELPEFRRDSLEALRQPLEEGRVSVVRARYRVWFPARFSLVAAMNPCPCGHLGDPRHECTCMLQQLDRYRGRLSGPLLDRIDLHVEVPAVSLDDLRQPRGEPTSEVADRVGTARRLQLRRFGESSPHPTNAAMGARLLRRHAAVSPTGQTLLDRAFDRLGLSARSLNRILKVARTIADLGGCDQIRPEHLAEAIQYRFLDRRSREAERFGTR